MAIGMGAAVRCPRVLLGVTVTVTMETSMRFLDHVMNAILQ